MSNITIQYSVDWKVDFWCWLDCLDCVIYFCWFKLASPDQNNPNFPHKLPYLFCILFYSVLLVPPDGCCVSLSFSEMETISPVPGGTWSYSAAMWMLQLDWTSGFYLIFMVCWRQLSNGQCYQLCCAVLHLYVTLGIERQTNCWQKNKLNTDPSTGA